MKSFVQFFSVLLSLFAVSLCGLSNDEMLQLSKASGRNRMIPVTQSNYQKILEGPRDFHLVLFLTSAAPQFRCVLCAEVRPAYEIVAGSWALDHPEGVAHTEDGKDVYFLSSEFTDARELFQKMKLESIPKMYHFPPSEVASENNWLNEAEEYLFFQGDHTELLKEWIATTTGHKINIKIPINYTRIAFNAGTTFALAVLAKIFSDKIKALFTSRLTWSGLSTIAILLLTSGYMFNQIRAVPYVSENRDGSVTYFAGGQQTQLAVETQIISFVYGFMSLLFVVLIKRVPEVKNPQAKLLAVTLVSAALFVVFSLLLAIFHIKSPAFPFQFLNIRI